MRHFVLFYIILSLVSCDYFEQKKIRTEDIVAEELDAINWNDVDEYPTFDHCEDAGMTERRACFEQGLTRYVMDFLSKQPMVVTETINDTVRVKFKVETSGEISVVDINSPDVVARELPAMDSLIVASLKGLPRIQPAIKRGQFVTTEFSLPIVISVE